MKTQLNLQLIEDSIPFVDDIPKLRNTIMALIKHIRKMEFTDIELKEIKESVWETLDQFCTTGDVFSLQHSDVDPVFTEKELKTRQSILSRFEKMNLCPDCGSPLQLLSSGVKCPNCNYWFCY